MTTYAGLRNDEEAYRLGPDAVARGLGPIVACLEHADGVVLGYADGSARFVEWERLGLEAGDPRVVGEASSSPRLKALSDE
jgi:hypothetical protein